MTARLIEPEECRTTIVRPALQVIGLWSEAAEDLLLGTALQESGLRFTHQLGGGPALGFWEMEPATHDDCWKNYLLARRSLANYVGSLSLPSWKWVSYGSWPPAAQLETNHKYACAMARIRYLRSPMELPQKGDVAGYAHMWKIVYNTVHGAGTEDEFIANWRKCYPDIRDRPPEQKEPVS